MFFIDLSGNHGDSILVVYQGETYNMVSESFEKMIFQAAFKIYEVFPNQLDFGVSIAGLKEKIQPDKVYTTLEALCLKYGLRNCAKINLHFHPLTITFWV